MVMNRSIQIRLTKEQYERIRNNAMLKGFSSLSDYLRVAALEQDLLLQQKIFEIHAYLLGNKPAPKFKKNPAARHT